MKYIFSYLLVILIFSNISTAQIKVDITPKSFNNKLQEKIALVKMPPINVQNLKIEDEKEKELGLPWRFGKDLDVNLNLSNSGSWTKIGKKGRVWRLKIHSPGAFSINLIYSEFYLPEGSTFHIYNQSKNYRIGAFTKRNNKSNKKFATGIVKGDVCILEYFEPNDQIGNGIISISKVIHAYRDIFNKASKSFGSSGSCNINVNCSEGDNWQNQKRSVAMVLTRNNTRICTGTLINNTKQDRTPYFLTANHCLESTNDTENWVFMFNYESPNCSNIDGPINKTISGCSVKARNSDSDFLLVELSSNPPESYNVYYAGWSRQNINSTKSVGIHHPKGDIKKISFDNNASSSSDYEPNPYLKNSHWKISNWDAGTTEPGSSGSPLFDQNHRIIGQLHGGSASCTSNTADFYGKFSISWDKGSTSNSRLKDWLDPINSGLITLNGINNCSDESISNINYKTNAIIEVCNSLEFNNINITNSANVTINTGGRLIIKRSFDMGVNTSLNIND